MRYPKIKAGKATASLVKNADGTYSVTIPAGGGVNIEALIKAIETKAVYTSSSDDDDSSSSNGTPSTWGSNGTNWTFTKANGQKAKMNGSKSATTADCTGTTLAQI
ncbi:MAG: hypothetical protein ACLUD2_15555 [Clostridium sp.]